MLEDLACLVIVSRLIVLQPRGGRIEPGSEREHERCRCNSGARTPPAFFPEEKPEHQKSHGQTERPLVALQRLTRGKDSRLCRIHRLDALLENLLRGIRPDGHEEPTGRLRDLLQPGFIELRLNRLPGNIADEVLPPVLGPERDERAFRRADADGEDADPVLRGFFRRGDPIFIEFLSIGEEDERAGLAFRLPERLLGGCNRGRDIGSSFRDNIGVQLVERIDRGTVVKRERCLEKGGTGERDEPDPVAFEQADKILGEKLGARQPCGRNVRRQHALGSIHGDDDITALLLDLPLDEPVSRLREGNQYQAQREDDENPAGNPADDTHGAGKLVAETGRNHFRNQGAPAEMRPHIERREDRQRQQPPEPERGTECQGNRLHNVCESRISAPRQARPAIRNQGKRSR